MANTSKASDYIKGQISSEMKVQCHAMLNALAKGMSEKVKNAVELDMGEPMGKKINGMEITFFLSTQSSMDQEQYDRTKDKMDVVIQNLKNPSTVISLINDNGVR